MRGLYPRREPLTRLRCFASQAPSPTRGEGKKASGLLPIPAACPEPFLQMWWRWRHHADRVLVLRNRDHDLARMQMQARLAEARAVAVNIIADNRPAHRYGMHPQLMGPARHRLQRQPSETLAAPEHSPVGDGGLPFRIGLLPPTPLGVETPERHVDGALILSRSAFDHRPIGL